MKRLRMWLRELTLTQQLLAIIFVFVSVFAVFVFVVLSQALDELTDTEMYRLLHNSQENLIYMINQNPDELPFVEENETFTQVVYDPDEEIFTVLNSGRLTDVLREDIVTKAVLDPSGTVDYKVTTSGEDETGVALYAMTLLKDGRYLVSIMFNEYQTKFRQSLVNGIINVTIMVVAVLFVLLVLWVGTLIIPLSQIKTYITRLRNDEPAVLNINRRDEIGEVATALVEMEKELSAQSKEKEEMVQNISHDLKTPIATIKSYAESIKDGVYPYETMEKSCDVIIEHADRLEKKVKSLIVLNKMGYLQDDVPEGNNLPMAEIIDKVILALNAIRPDVRFATEIDESVCFHGEEEPWRIVIENLVENALRYARHTIRITLVKDELSVYNDGDKISRKIIDKLFVPYEKGSGGQFGLGLSIVQKVCQTYGYKVTAENMTEGVCFRIVKNTSARTRRRSRGKGKKGNTGQKA